MTVSQPGAFIQTPLEPSSPRHDSRLPAAHLSQALISGCSLLLRYGVALVSASLAVLIRTLLTPLWGYQLPFLTLFPAVFFSAWYGGLGPGLVTTALCAAAAAYLWLAPFHSFAIAQSADVVGLGLAVLVMLLITWLTAARQRSEAAERVQREQLQVILSSIGDAVIVTDAQGLVTFMNPTARALTGWQHGAVGQPLTTVFTIVNEETRRPGENPVTKVLRTGTVVGLTNHTVLRTQDGREIPIDDSGAPLRDAQGRIRGVVLVFHDAAEQRHAEDALRRAHEELAQREASLSEWKNRYETAARASGQILFHWYPATGTMTWGPHLEDILGYSATELVGIADFLALVHPESRVGAEAAVGLRTAQEPAQLEYRLRRKDEKYVWMTATSLHLPRDDQSAPVEIVGFLADITARKEAEETLARHAAELQRANADLRQVAYISAHDLQEPVRQMSLYTQRLSQRYRDSLDAETREATSFIVEGAERMTAKFTDLVHYLDVDEQVEDRTATDCEEVLRRTLEALQELITANAAVITHDPLPVLIANAKHLHRLFRELLDNALKFCLSVPPRVHIWAERQERGWRFAVRDNGIGLDPQWNDQLFGLFRRLHSHQQYPGTGMGLAICKKIVELHGGRIWVESTPDQGSIFYFTLSDIEAG